MAINVELMVNMLKGASSKLREHEDYLNRINVFPVADGDTGTNMAYTMHAVERVLNGRKFENLKELGETVLKQALLESRGNSGTLLTQFLKGLSQNWEGQLLTLPEFSQSLELASKAADKSFLEPRPGTALDVIREVAEAAKQLTEKEIDPVNYFKTLIETAQTALERTKQILPQMRKARVVDSGGAGIVFLLGGFLEGLQQKAVHIQEADISQMQDTPEEQLEFRYCTEVVVKSDLVDQDMLQGQLLELGDSLQIVQAQGILKIHVHTNQPQEVRSLLSQFGQETSFKAEDMVLMQKANILRRHSSFAEAASGQLKPLLIITDSSADLPLPWIQSLPLKIIQIPLFQAGEGEDISHSLNHHQFYEKMGLEPSFSPKTSKASVGQFLEAYREALEIAEKIVCLPISSGISGTYESALQAREMLEDNERILVIDTNTSSSGLAILSHLVANHGHLSLDELEQLLKEWKRNLEAYFLVENTKYLIRGGRLTGTKATLSRLFRIQPLLKLEKGKIQPQKEKNWFGNSQKMNRLLFKKARQTHHRKHLEHALIVYAGTEAKSRAVELKTQITQELGLSDDLIHLIPLNLVVGAHTGPGTMGLIMY
jgi:uncharacterized protein